MKKKIVIFISCLIAFGICNLKAQPVYFVDGYHGGMYGHFPLWNTQFYVDNLLKYPEWKICIEIEPETWDVVQRETPDAYRALQKMAGSPRIEFTNPTLAQPYMYNISGESIIRQFAHGIDMLRKHFPDVKFSTYSVEEPCFTSALPQILKSFGINYAVLKCPNTCWGGYSEAYGGELVNWIGPDGTTILTVPRYACEDLGNDVWTTIANSNSKEYIDACFAAGIKHPAGMCFQDAGWRNGPWIGHGDNIKGNSIYTTWVNYFENISVGKTDDNHHFTQESFLPGLMWGSQVLQKIAQEVRASENNMIMAEKMNVMNYIMTRRIVDDFLFRKAWYNLALSQHHDSWIVPYNGLFPGKTWAQAIEGWTKATDEIASGIIQQMLSNTRQGGEPTVLRIVNTTAAPREELVEAVLPAAYFWKNIALTDDQNNEIQVHAYLKEDKAIYQFIAKVPAFGFAHYHIKAGQRSLPAMPSVCHSFYNVKNDYVVESDMYRIIFDLRKGGIIKSLIAKKMNNKEFVDGRSDFGFGELRGFFYDENKFISNTENTASVYVSQHTPSSITVDITGQIAGHPTVQHITLNQGQERIDCSLEIAWKDNPGIGEYKSDDTYRAKRRPFYDDRYKLVLMLPTDVGGEQQVYKNAPFDVCESRLEDTFYASWDSIKHNIILNWVDFSGKNRQYGLALFTDHTTTYTHGKDFPPGLTIQYSGRGLWGRDYPITENTKINYALLPHTQKWDQAGIWTESVNLNEPLVVKILSGGVAGESKSLVSFNKTGYEITTTEIKNNEIYLRLFNAESDDKPVALSLGFAPSKVEKVQLNGDIINNIPVKKLNGQDAIEISMPRFGLTTLKLTL